jgi:multiple sugar transport system permease protein
VSRAGLLRRQDFDPPGAGTAITGRQRASRALMTLRRHGRLWAWCYLMLLPVLAIYAYVRIFPIARSFQLSFYDWKLMARVRPFIGLANYKRMFADENFQIAIWNTTAYSLAIVLISTAIALPLAVVLARRGKASVIYQTIYFLPVITPVVPMAIAWKWIYDYNYGLLNYILSVVGIPPIAWLTDAHIALWALIIMGVWRGLGFSLVIFLVGIRNIPATYMEAASLDGAGEVQKFWHVTLPLLRPIILYVLVTSTISAYNVFTQVYVMTLGSQSAPGQAVRVLVYDIYQNAFQYFRMGYGSAEAVTLTFIVLAFTLIQFRALRSQETA